MKNNKKFMYTIMHIVHNDKKSLPLKGSDCASCSIHVMGCYTAFKNHFRVGKWLRGKTLVVQYF